jgi:acyl-coenzyme A thioesterase PaaI-like protein
MLQTESPEKLSLDQNTGSTKEPQDENHMSSEHIQDVAVRDSALIREFKLKGGSHPIRSSRTVLKIPSQHIANNLTSSTLAGPGKLAPNPYVLFCDGIGALVAVYHVGAKLAGHTGIVHGGLLMTLLDDCMGRACFPLLAGKVAVTAKFEVSFRRPVAVDSVILIKAETEKVEGRKASVKAQILDCLDESMLYVEASGLFVEPRNSAQMDKLM